MMRYILVIVVAVYFRGTIATPVEPRERAWLADDLADVQGDAEGYNSAAHATDDGGASRRYLLNLLSSILEEEAEGPPSRHPLPSGGPVRAAGSAPRGTAVHKRPSFWQAMGGPLPVQTRYVSFGSRLEPDKAKSQGARINAMRYGRRR